jgi:lipopolysaccharide transport system ATP-binding protein
VFWALDNVSFTVEHGQSLGVLGHNGAGKTTILKLLSGITKPTSGAIQVNGRVASLIELGAGFHPEMTGRENVFLNGVILGLTRREIAREFDSIVDFAGVERYIDTPLKRYSSGMYVRLAFAVAAHIDPAILLVDEVLAVGDIAFRAKCYRRMAQLRERGTAIVLVSHDVYAVRDTCDRGLLLWEGKLIEEGVTEDVITAYLARMYAASERNSHVTDNTAADRAVDSGPRCEKNKVLTRFS